jgi:hypothetical protein
MLLRVRLAFLELGLWRCLGWQRSGLAGPIDLKTSKTRDLAPIDRNSPCGAWVEIDATRPFKASPSFAAVPGPREAGLPPYPWQAVVQGRRGFLSNLFFPSTSPFQYWLLNACVPVGYTGTQTLLTGFDSCALPLRRWNRPSPYPRPRGVLLAAWLRADLGSQIVAAATT